MQVRLRDEHTRDAARPHKAPSVREIKDRAAQAIAAVSSTASAVGQVRGGRDTRDGRCGPTAASAASTRALDFSLCDSCAEQPRFASYACVAPSFASAEISTYRSTGNPEAKLARRMHARVSFMCNLPGRMLAL